MKQPDHREFFITRERVWEHDAIDHIAVQSSTVEVDVFHPNAGDEVGTVRLEWWVVASDEREHADGRYRKPGCGS